MTAHQREGVQSDLGRQWARVWSDLNLVPPAGLFEQLVAAYEEPQRHYHSWQHLRECLAHFEEVHDLANHPGEVAIALWFHDAIYDVHGKANEQRSADWAVAALASAKVPAASCERVRQLIMVTRHDAVPHDADQQLLVDIDLAILGASPQRFAEYEQQVRAEYSWVPGLLYNMKRKAVLNAFLRRKHIYSTPHFRQRYEAQARSNLGARA